MDKANWSPEEAVQLARELNNFGTHYRNAVASLYNTFSLELSNYWRGKNYNIVAEYMNEHYDEFDSITNSMCVTIPSVIQSIASLQAEDGLGSVSVFNYEINDPSGIDSAVTFNLVPMTEESTDGSIVLTQDVVTKYIDGNGEPSLNYYQERMEEYMNSYSGTLDQFSSIREFNDALKAAYEAIENFKTFSTNAVKNIIEETKIRADVELGKITETDAETKDLAITALGDTSSATTSKTSTSIIHPNYYSSSHGAISKSNTSTNLSNNSNFSSSNVSKESSENLNTGTNKESSNVQYDKPIGPEIDAKNKQVINNYLNSDYEKGIEDTNTYTINGKKMYIDEIKDNGDSYTITYYDKERFDADSNYTTPDTMEIKK